MVRIKDVQAAAHGLLFHYIVTLILPATIALTPCGLSFFVSHQDVRELVASNLALSLCIIIPTLLFVGLLLSEVGSLLEFSILDKWRRRSDENHWDNWLNYLSLDLPMHHIGRRYVSNMATFLKFELSAFCATLIAFTSTWFAFPLQEVPSTVCHLIRWSALLAFVLLAISAHQTHGALSETRAKLVSGHSSQGGHGAPPA